MITLLSHNLLLFDMPFLISRAFPYLLFYFVINFVSVFTLSKLLYYNRCKKKDYLFTYISIGNTIFLLCFVLDNVEMKLGLALGLFAIFGIIRYRTSQIGIKEMTYLFMIIGLSVVNALANHKIGLAELIFSNLVIIGGVWIKERYLYRINETYKLVQYDLVQNIKPENHTLLIEDIRNRLGLDISRIEVGKVSFLKDSVTLRVYFEEKSGGIVSNYVLNGNDASGDEDED